jgi:radical SAM superfamily enzyme YgiQ (UPF0313 family)
LRPADVVGVYGGLTSTIPRLYDVVRYYRERGVTVVAGGQHFVEENFAEAFEAGIDYLVLGEGEHTIRELFQALRGEGAVEHVRGIAYRPNGTVVRTVPRPPITDFDELPLPDFSLVRYAKITWFPVERIRGCGMDCEFCTVKGKPRQARAERLLQHISTLIESHNARKFFVVDDMFGQHRRQTVAFCNMLADYQKSTGVKLQLMVQMRLDKARDAEMLGAMRHAGVSDIAIGFESPIPEELKAMNKRIKPGDMVAQARIYRRYGFLVHGMFIFGYPMKGDAAYAMNGRRRVHHFRRFIRRARLDTIQILLPVPLPGTQLRERLMKQGRIYPLTELGWEYYDGNFPLFVPDPPMTPQQMQKAARRIMGGFYRFKHMFMVAVHVFSFPALVFFLHDIKRGWRGWHRHWRNSLIRFGGWLTMKSWISAFKRDAFSHKLQRAQHSLGRSRDSQPRRPRQTTAEGVPLAR